MDHPVSTTAPAPAPVPAPHSPSERSGLTLRATLLGASLSILAGLIAHYHDGVILHLETTQHNGVAPLVLFLMLLAAGLVNPLLHRIRPRLAFRGAELGVALALALVATPLSRTFAGNWVRMVGYTQSLLDAQHTGVATLQKANLFEALPPGAILSSDAARLFDDGVAGQIGAMARLRDIPWGDWIRPALYWAPLMLGFLVLGFALARLLYRQWAERELVPFPLAEIAADLVRRQQQRPFPDIFYTRSFWYGFCLMAVVFGINGIHAYAPRMIEIPIKFTFYELSQQFPFLKNSLEGYSLLRSNLYFAVIAAAVLLPSEISFTSWFTWPIMVVCTYLYYVQTGQKFGGLENTMMMTGSFWAMAAVILYAGRTYYLALLRRALDFRRHRGDDPGGVDAAAIRTCRIFLLAAASFVALLTLYGIPLDLAIIWTLALLVFFLVLCRLLAEMGIPWLPLPGVAPLPFLLSVLGEKALGAKALALLTLQNHATLNTTVFIPPMAANAAHVETRLTGRPTPLRLLLPLAAILTVAFTATAIWIGYSSEGAVNDYPIRSFGTINTTAATIQNRYLQGNAAPDLRTLFSRNLPLRERWASVRVDPRFPPLFAFGAAMILLTGFARLRFAWFPLHPLPLVLIGSWIMSRYYFSFLVGWLIKSAILKIGGGRLFEKTRPFFVGVLIGLAFIFSLWVVVNTIVFRHHNFTMELQWTLPLRDMFST